MGLVHAYSGDGTWCGLKKSERMVHNWDETTCQKCLHKALDHPHADAWGWTNKIMGILKQLGVSPDSDDSESASWD